jgi:hypothetical protein
MRSLKSRICADEPPMLIFATSSRPEARPPSSRRSLMKPSDVSFSGSCARMTFSSAALPSSDVTGGPTWATRELSFRPAA